MSYEGRVENIRGDVQVQTCTGVRTMNSLCTIVAPAIGRTRSRYFGPIFGKVATSLGKN